MDSFFTAIRIECAQNVLIARAFLNTMHTHFLQWSAEIIANGTFHYADKYYSNSHRIHGLPKDRIMRDPNHIYLLEGTGSEAVNGWSATDAGRYYAFLHIKAVKGNYLHAEQAPHIAQKDLHDAEETLLKVTEDIHHNAQKPFNNEQERTQLINQLLNIFNNFIYDQNLPIRQDVFCNKHLIKPITTDTAYLNTEISFQLFTAGRRYFPPQELQHFSDIPDLGEIIQYTKGIWMYTYQSFFFELMPGKYWTYDTDKKTTDKYVLINLMGEVFQSNNLTDMERITFEQHQRYFSS